MYSAKDRNDRLMSVKVFLFLDHILRGMVDADVDPADIFADHAEHEQDHSADQCGNGHQGCPSGRDLGMQQLMDDSIQRHDKPEQRDHGSDEGGESERLDGERGKPVDP